MEKTFFNACEAWTDNEYLIYQKKELEKIVVHAKKFSPYYTKAFENLNFNADDKFPLSHLPFLTPQELRENLPPLNRNLLTSSTNGFSVFQSGGTTGTPKTSLFTHEDMEWINQCNLRGFHAVGLTNEDRVANLWAVGGLYMTFIHMNRMLQEYGCTSFPFSNATPIDFIESVSQQFEINVFTGITSVVLNTLREIHRRQPGSLKVDKIFYGGEHIYDNDREELIREFGVKTIKAPGYGTVDSWYLGYQCAHTTHNQFHIFNDQVYLEIINEDTGAHCSPGEIGMLFATVYHRKLTPIIRFRVGDLARWVSEPCSCGRTPALFELLGRGDDVLRIGYDSIDYGAVQKLIHGFEGASGQLQMEKKRIEGRDQLIFRIETAEPSENHASMTSKLIEKFLMDRPSFRGFVNKGTVWPLKIEWVPIGGLPQNPRTGKLIRVIDSI